MDVSWINLALLALLSVGQAALLIGMINRIHARPLPESVLHRLKQLHYLLMLAFPLALVWFAGIRGPALLSGGSWSLLPAWVLAYLALCGGVAACLPFVAARRWFARPPGLQLSNHSYTVDIPERLGFRPLGNGPYQWAMAIPGNESWRLEVTEKHFAHPRVPAAWNGLSILQITDLHFTGTIDRPYFECVADIAREMHPDLIVMTGDLLDDAELLSWIPSTLGALAAPLGKYFILGNHDWRLGDTAPTRQLLQDLGWQDVSGAIVQIDHAGHPLAIGGTERPWMGQHPNLSQVDAAVFRLLLSHTPDNLVWARKNAADLMLAGHNHGGQVQLPLFGPVYAPSAFGCQYAGGVFWEPPTLLYVCRGISGELPLRWRCKPELTKIVLHPPSDTQA